MIRRLLSNLVIALILCGILGLAVWPLHKNVLEPRRQRLLGYMQDPPYQLAQASAYAFSVASGEWGQVVPGAPPLSPSDLPFRTASLILGGFRGPVLIYLWSAAEEEKREKAHFNLIDYHMKIALLQPDYPEVWVDRAWNLAWNVSVQWNTPEMKYKWIRYAIDFLKVGVRKNPNNVTILTQMGEIYNRKFGHSVESDYYRQWVRRDEGRSTFLIAHEWYDRARKVSRKLGQRHRQFSMPVLNSLACHAVSDYARESTQLMYDAFAEADELRKEGKLAAARQRFDEGSKLLADAIGAWVWAQQEWEEQLSGYRAPGLPHEKFVLEAQQKGQQLTDISKVISLENLDEILSQIERPEFW